MNMQAILQQAQKMQEEMKKTQDEIALKHVSGEAGGGMVKAVVTGAGKIVSIKLSKEAVDPNDIEMLEDLIVAAVNKALGDASRLADSEMEKVASLMPNIPGMNLPF